MTSGKHRAHAPVGIEGGVLARADRAGTREALWLALLILVAILA